MPSDWFDVVIFVKDFLNLVFADVRDAAIDSLVDF